METADAGRDGGGMSYTGIDDCFGRSVHVGDVVKFIFRRDTSEPEVGYVDHDGTPYVAYGEVRMSPYLGVYIVHGGSCYRLRPSTPLEVIPEDKIVDRKMLIYSLALEAADDEMPETLHVRRSSTDVTS